jgi:hypothetical protein
MRLTRGTRCSFFGWVSSTDCGQFLTHAFKCKSRRSQRRPPCVGSGGFGQTEPFGSIAEMVISSESRGASVDFADRPVPYTLSRSAIRIALLLSLLCVANVISNGKAEVCPKKDWNRKKIIIPLVFFSRIVDKYFYLRQKLSIRKYFSEKVRFHN